MAEGSKILKEYLNSIYFGNGAYGVESAARVYFGKVHGYNSVGNSGPERAQAAGTRRDTPAPRC